MVIEFLGRMLEVQRDDAGDTQVYRVRGQVFFASAGQLGAAFDYQHVAPQVQIELRDAHLWDLTAVARSVARRLSNECML